MTVHEVPDALTPANLRNQVPHLGRALEVLPLLDVPERTRVECRRAANALIKVSGLAADQILLDPLFMVPLLKRFGVHGPRGITSKTWANHRSALSRLAQRLGWVQKYGRSQHPVSNPAWRQLLDAVTRSPQKSALTGFASWCDSQGLAPTDIDRGHLDSYRAWRAAHTYDRWQNQTADSVLRIWNQHAGTSPAWAVQRLQGSRDPRIKVAPREAFHPDFLAAADRFLLSLREPDLLAMEAVKPLAKLTVDALRRVLLRAATWVSEHGTPLGEIRQLRQVIRAEVLKQILEEIIESKRRALPPGAKPTPKCWTSSYSRTLGDVFIKAARHLGDVPASEQELLVRLRRAATPPRRSIPADIRDATLAITDDEELRRLYFDLPRLAATEAERLRRAGRPARAAELSEVAVALFLLMDKPLRRRALLGIRHDVHLRRDAAGRIARLQLPQDLSKTAMEVDVLLSRPARAALARHLRLHHPRLAAEPGDSFLFPSRVKGIPRAPEPFARRVRVFVEGVLRTRFSVHMARHIAATILMSDDWDNSVVARDLLTHRDDRTTRHYYGFARGRAADREWRRTVEDEAKRLGRQEQRKNRKGKTPDPGPDGEGPDDAEDGMEDA